MEFVTNNVTLYMHDVEWMICEDILSYMQYRKCQPQLYLYTMNLIQSHHVIKS